MKTERYAFILISDQKYWKKLSQSGKTDIRVHAFVRKNHVAPRAAEKLLFYVKKPVMQILGIADFVERLTGSTSELWAMYGAETCFASFDEYCQFAQGRTEMTFVRFRNFKELANPKSTDTIRIILKNLGFRGKYVNKETMAELAS